MRSPSIGFGHIRRCLSLAEALQARGASVVFLVNPESNPNQWMPDGSAVALETVPANEAATLTMTCEHVERRGIGALVVDSCDVGDSALGSVQVPVIAIVDAPPPRPLPVSLVINSAADASRHPHPTESGSRALLGPQYVLLRRDFESVPPRDVKHTVEHVLVTTGGGDVRGFSLQMLSVARRALPSAHISIVAGLYFPPALIDALERKSRSDGGIEVLRPSYTVRDLMLGADIALTTGGQTTYELAATGTPACAVRFARNQTGNLTGLSDRGTLDWVGDVDDTDVEVRLEHSLRRLAADRDCSQGNGLRGACGGRRPGRCQGSESSPRVVRVKANSIADRQSTHWGRRTVLHRG